MLLLRFLMVLVGTAVLVLYTAVALAVLYLYRWYLSHPPDPIVLAGLFLSVVVLGSYLGFRLGAVRLVASLDTRELTSQTAPGLVRRLDRLCLQMEVSRPTLLVADLEAPNALTVGGPRDGAIILDRRLFELLTLEELEAILAHELAHIERYDTFLNTLALTAARLLVTLVFLALLPVIVFLAGVDRASAWYVGRPNVHHVGLSGLFQRAIAITVALLLSVLTIAFLAHSRRQEFAADRRAAEVTGRPLALARALVKIRRATDPRRGLQRLLYIHDDPSERNRWLSTHPPLSERVDQLRWLAADGRSERRLRRLQTGE